MLNVNRKMVLGLEIKPYSSLARRTVFDENRNNETDYPSDMGFDMTYNVTTNLRAAVTVNTDFAEVEVDDRRVNLTRFPLYYPEKRDFFLEGSSVFNFAVRNGAFPYFSRRIGLDKGEQIPIVFGSRLGGQTGRYELGFIQVRTAEHKDTPAEDFTIGRIKRSLFRQSSIGVIYTRRAGGTINDETELPDRHTFGADLDLSTSRFLCDKNFQFEAFFVWHTDPESDGTSSLSDRLARGIRINFPNDLWRIHTSYREFGDEYNPAAGFNDRNGIRRLNPGMFFAPRPSKIGFIRQFEFGFNHLVMADFSNKVETWWTNYTLLGIKFESSDELSINVQRKFERLKNNFTIHEDITIPVGEYNTFDWRLTGKTAGHRALSGNASFFKGSFWSGDRTVYEFGLTLKPIPGISITTLVERNDVNLKEGDFSTNLLRFSGGWHISPWTSITGNVQYDDVTDIAGLFVKFRWIIRPGSDLFIVYTHNWQNYGNNFEDINLSTLSKAAITKINYTFRF